MKVSAGVETGSSDWHFFLMTAANFLMQEGTGNVRKYFISKGIISKQWHVSSFFDLLKFLAPFRQKSYLLRNAEPS